MIKDRNIIYYISLVSFFSFIISIFGFGYAYVAVNGVKQPSNKNLEKKKKDDSISCQLANGSSIGIIFFLSFGSILLLYLIFTYEIPFSSNKKLIILRIISIIVLTSLVVSLVWISPYRVGYRKNIDPLDDSDFKNMQEKHNTIAIISFTFTMLYIYLTYKSLIKKDSISQDFKNTIYLFLLLSIVAYLTLIGIGIVFVAGKAEAYDLTLFPIAEIIFYISFLISILIYGTCWKKIISAKHQNYHSNISKMINKAFNKNSSIKNYES